MSKDKKSRHNFYWKERKSSLEFFKKFFVYSILVIIFIISLIILIYRLINGDMRRSDVFHKTTSVPEVTSTSVPEATSTSAPEEVSFEKGLTLQENRLDNLENSLNQMKHLSQMTQQIIAFEMLQEILDGHLPINTLILYLKKQSEPWAADILNTFTPIKEVKTYAQLHDLLVLPSSPNPSATTQNVNNIINSFISIRKLGGDDHRATRMFQDIHMALDKHDIQQALILFETLPPEQQAQLSAWKQGVQDRLSLETIKQKVLLGLSGS